MSVTKEVTLITSLPVVHHGKLQQIVSSMYGVHIFGTGQ